MNAERMKTLTYSGVQVEGGGAANIFHHNRLPGQNPLRPPDSDDCWQRLWLYQNVDHDTRPTLQDEI